MSFAASWPFLQYEWKSNFVQLLVCRSKTCGYLVSYVSGHHLNVHDLISVRYYSHCGATMQVAFAINHFGCSVAARRPFAELQGLNWKGWCASQFNVFCFFCATCSIVTTRLNSCWRLFEPFALRSESCVVFLWHWYRSTAYVSFCLSSLRGLAWFCSNCSVLSHANLSTLLLNVCRWQLSFISIQEREKRLEFLCNW